MTVHELFVDDFFDVKQTIKTNPIYLSVSDSISFGENTEHNNRTRKVHDIFGVIQQQIVRTSIKKLTVNHVLNFNQHFSKGIHFAEVFDFFPVFQVVDGYVGRGDSSVLTFHENIVVYKTTPIRQTLTLNQIIAINVIRNLIVQDSFDLSEGIVGFKYDDHFVATTTTPLPVSPISDVVFTINTFSVTVPAPDFGDSLNLEFARVSQKTRGNDSILARPSYWPRTQSMSLTFSYLTEEQKLRMQEFLKISLGRTTTYQDHYGNSWLGIIKTPGAPFKQTGRNIFEVTIDFQGERV